MRIVRYTNAMNTQNPGKPTSARAANKVPRIALAKPSHRSWWK